MRFRFWFSMVGSGFEVGAWSMKHSTLNQRVYRGTSLISTHLLLGPYMRTTPRVLWWFYGGGGGFLWARYLCRVQGLGLVPAA